MKRGASFAPFLLFAILTVVWTWPLVRHFGAGIPGEPGDNFSFLWNLWWMRRVLATGGSFFHSTFLLHPLGVDLVNHPHTAFQGLLTATLLAPLSIVTAENVYILVCVFGNAATAYALALEVGGGRRAATLAAVTFGGSPYIAAHLLGHFDLLSAWVLPLFALALRRALRGGSVGASVGCGLVAGVAAYSAYYYVIYLGLFAVTYTVAWVKPLSIGMFERRQTRLTAAARRAVWAALGFDALLLIWIRVAGGGTIALPGAAVSLHGSRNPLTVAWLLLLVAALTSRRLSVTVRPTSRALGPGVLKALGVVLLVFLVCAAPLIVQAASVMAQGRYAAQQYYWRSAPHGVDVLALVAGNPFHPLVGGAVTRWYRFANADRIEGVAWIGLVPLMLLFGLRGRWADREEAGRWIAVGAVSLVWALGPTAMLGGLDLGLPLPESLVRFVPVVSDARMPGRAMVLVYLAVGMLLALRLPALQGRWSRPGWQRVLVAGVLLDYLAAPIPLTALDRPVVYERLAALDDQGAVVELPLGIGDGLTVGTGSQDRRILYYATVHGHPVVGGFIGRLPAGTAAAYLKMPVVGNLLRLSGGEPAVQEAGPAAGGVPFRYVIINRETASTGLVAYARAALRLELLVSAEGRELYRVLDERR
jgi:hypothetical protein